MTRYGQADLMKQITEKQRLIAHLMTLIGTEHRSELRNATDDWLNFVLEVIHDDTEPEAMAFKLLCKERKTLKWLKYELERVNTKEDHTWRF